MNTHLVAPSEPALSAALANLRFLIGVDGGGTGTRLRLTDREGRLLGTGDAGPSALGQGGEQAWRHIGQALGLAARQAGIETPQPSQCAIGLGLSGVSVASQAQHFLGLNPGYAVLALDGDGWTTVLGAHGGKPGAVVAAGTGTVGEVLREDGSRACLSGWGWIAGDEGSGAWLGLQAVRRAQAALDGREPGGTLSDKVLDVIGRERIAINAWNAAAGQAGYASLARLVFDCADSDLFAATLIDEAVHELEKLSHALDPEGRLPLALCGSIALRLAPRFFPALRARCVPAQGDSAEGGLHLVRQALASLSP
jgi:glucosamine kinase